MLLKNIISKNRNAAFSILHQLVMAIYGFGILFILFHSSSKEEAGRWILFASAISLADMLMHGFMQTPVIRLVSSSKQLQKDIKIITSNVLVFSIYIWSFISLLVITSKFVYPSEFTNDLQWYPVLGLLMIAYNAGWWINHALSDFKSILYQRLIFSTASIAIIFYFLFTQKTIHAEQIIISQIAGYLASIIASQTKFRKITFRISHIGKDHQKHFFNYGKYTAGSMMMGSLLRNADIFMIAAFLGQGFVAIYSAAQKTVEIFEVALRGLAAHSLPEFCKLSTDPKELFRKYKKTTLKLILSFLPISILMFIFSTEVIQLLSGSTEYRDASIILRVFMIYVPFLVADRMTGVTLESMGMAKHNFAKMIMLLIVNLAGNAIALSYFHSLAAVAAVSIFATSTGIVFGLAFLKSRIDGPLFPKNPVSLLKPAHK